MESKIGIEKKVYLSKIKMRMGKKLRTQNFANTAFYLTWKIIFRLMICLARNGLNLSRRIVSHFATRAIEIVFYLATKNVSIFSRYLCY